MRRFCIVKGKQRKLSLKEKLAVAMKCWCGLDYLHSKTLCHKDISPDNILVSTLWESLKKAECTDFVLLGIE